MTPIVPESLILVPGVLCNHRLWHHQLEGLTDVSRPSVAEVHRDDSLAAMADRLLSQAPPRFALAGLSLGGYLCLEVMRQASRRVTRLALLSTSAEADVRERSEVRGTLIELARNRHFESVLRMSVPAMLGRRGGTGTTLRLEVETMAREVGAEAFQRQQVASLNRPDSRPELSQYNLPCLVLCGSEDVLTPPDLHRQLAAQIQQAQLRVIEGCGHLTPLERPEEVNAAFRDWLQRPR